MCYLAKCHETLFPIKLFNFTFKSFTSFFVFENTVYSIANFEMSIVNDYEDTQFFVLRSPVFSDVEVIANGYLNTPSNLFCLIVSLNSVRENFTFTVRLRVVIKFT